MLQLMNVLSRGYMSELRDDETRRFWHRQQKAYPGVLEITKAPGNLMFNGYE